MNLVCFNGKFLPADEPIFTVQNRGFKYGDGVFETIKIYKGKILLEAFHFERLLLSLKMLQIKNEINTSSISLLIIELCNKNNCTDLARVRLTVFRNGQNKAQYVIEAFSISNETNYWNEKGFAIDLYPYARKSMDAFSNFKTANFLPYVLADIYAKENALDDAVVLNSNNKICDTSRANIFLIINKEIFTPALHQGCINGVMRRFLIDGLKKLNYKICQDSITEADLLAADEVFLTNAIYGMRAVSSFKEKKFGNIITLSIYQKLVSTFYG